MEVHFSKNEESAGVSEKLRLKIRLERFLYSMLEKTKKFRYRRQRAKRGYSDHDVLDIQMWFVRTLRPMFENIFANLYSHPEEITFEEWRSIIAEMVGLLKVMDWEDEAFVRKQMGISIQDFGMDTFNSIEVEREKARVRFMELFSKWFWKLSY